jgi:formylglycine-generating enzyme required for sulfatase activity
VAPVAIPRARRLLSLLLAFVASALPLATHVTRADVSESATPAIAPPRTCPDDMVEVDGDYCPYVFEKCNDWIEKEQKLRCAEFAPTGACMMHARHEHFCIDVYEWPNKAGTKPDIGVSWREAKASCEKAGRRLCLDSEWTLACEGKEHWPYPWGYTRNAEACNIDRTHPPPIPTLYENPATRPSEIARLDQREPSGARESCVSPYGVRDTVGNVDEWVVNESNFPFKSALNGGYWGPVRDRCRSITTGHPETFSYYQTGFRCCADPSSR